MQTTTDYGVALIFVFRSHIVGVLLEIASCFRTCLDEIEVCSLEPVEVFCIVRRVFQNIFIPSFGGREVIENLFIIFMKKLDEDRYPCPCWELL